MEDAHELLANVVNALERHCKVKEQNVCQSRNGEAIDKLKRDDTIIVLPADDSGEQGGVS